MGYKTILTLVLAATIIIRETQQADSSNSTKPSALSEQLDRWINQVSSLLSPAANEETTDEPVGNSIILSKLRTREEKIRKLLKDLKNSKVGGGIFGLRPRAFNGLKVLKNLIQNNQKLALGMSIEAAKSRPRILDKFATFLLEKTTNSLKKFQDMAENIIRKIPVPGQDMAVAMMRNRPRPLLRTINNIKKTIESQPGLQLLELRQNLMNSAQEPGKQLGKQVATSVLKKVNGPTVKLIISVRKLLRAMPRPFVQTLKSVQKLLRNGRISNRRPKIFRKLIEDLTKSPVRHPLLNTINFMRSLNKNRAHPILDTMANIQRLILTIPCTVQTFTRNKVSARREERIYRRRIIPRPLFTLIRLWERLRKLPLFSMYNKGPFMCIFVPPDETPSGETTPPAGSESNPENKTPESNQENKTPESNPENKTPESNPENKTPESNPENKTPESNPENKTPESNPENKTPESNPENKTPESKPVNKTPESNPESKTPTPLDIEDLVETETSASPPGGVAEVTTPTVGMATTPKGELTTPNAAPSTTEDDDYVDIDFGNNYT